MLAKTLGKIDWFYPILAVVLIALSILVLFSLRSVLNALNVASEFDPDVAVAKTKINVDKLDKAYSVAFEREILKLDFAQ